MYDYSVLVIWQEIEEQREKDKQNWLDFFNNSKVSYVCKEKKSLVVVLCATLLMVTIVLIINNF